MTLKKESFYHQEIRKIILEALSKTKGNRTYAASLLGIPLRSLRAKIRYYSLDREFPPNHKPPQLIDKTEEIQDGPASF